MTSLENLAEMKLEMLIRVAAAAAAVALSSQCHALAADASQACSKLLPKGGSLPAAPVDAVAAPVRASALFTSAHFAVAELRTGDRRSGQAARLLAISGKGDASHVFAELRAAGADSAVLAWWMPARDGGVDGALRRLAVLEHLYALVLREPPLTSYDVRATGGESQAKAQSQPDLLVQLARMRNCAAEDVARTGAKVLVKTWEMPSLTKPVARGAGGLDVSARVTYPAADGLAGSITIARGACLACSTQVQRDGGAGCTLFDSHGHADGTDDVAETTVVSFSGVVERTRIILPTTRVDVGSMKPFARRPSITGR